MQTGIPCAAVLALVMLVPAAASLAAQAQQAGSFTISGRINACDHHKCGFVRLVESLPNKGRHSSAITPVRSNKTFAIHATVRDMPAGQYSIEYGTSLRDLAPTNESLPIDGRNRDLGVICTGDVCKDL